MTKKSNFDLENELIAAGFVKSNENVPQCDRRFMYRTWTKEYVTTWSVAWYGQTEHHFIVDVRVTYFNNKPLGVTASLSNGKVRDYGYDKRAYNAIRDTIKNNGFDIAS